MKRVALLALLPAILGILCLSPILAQPVKIPHEEPSPVRGAFDSPALLLEYGNVFNWLNTRQYQNARTLLNEIEDTELPPDLRYLIDRYNELCRQLFDTLDRLDTLVTEASRLVNEKRVDVAVPVLASAEAYTRDARMLMAEIDTATESVTDLTGFLAGSVSGQYKARYDRLMESLQQVNRLIDEFNRLQEDLRQRRDRQQAEYIPTVLSLEAAPEEIFANEILTASGILSYSGQPLSNRRIVFILDNETSAETTTDLNGAYHASFVIPGDLIQPYRDQDYFTAPVSLKAIFTPSGADDTPYLASESTPVTVQVRYYPTRLDLSIPDAAYPGLPFVINGRITTRDSAPAHTVQILLDDTLITTQLVADSFRIEIKTPPRISSGEHILKVIALPAGRSAGTSAVHALEIIRELPVTVEVKLPPLIVLSQPASISGRVYHKSQPLADAVIAIHINNSGVIVNSGPDGSFAASLATAINFSFFNSQDIYLTVKPAGNIPISTSMTYQVRTINPITTALLAAIIIYLLIRLGNIAAQRRSRAAPASPGLVILPPLFVPDTHPKPSGIAGRVLAAYQNSLSVVETRTGLLMFPPTTLREYLVKAAMPPAAGRSFASLTAIAETALYSAVSLDDAIASQAEKLAGIIREELRRGAP